MKCLNLALLLVLFLVVSLTPASAVEIANSVNLSKNQTEDLNLSKTNLEDNKQLIDDKVSSIKFYTDSLNSTMNKISDKKQLIQDDVNFISDNWWKFWMWGQIGQKTTELISIMDELKILSDDLKRDAINIQEEANQLKSVTFSNNTLNKSSEEDAKEIAEEIRKSLKIPITITHFNAANLKEGDIVQYKSQNKHYCIYK